ncbi:hypothetical protein EPM78_10550 [Neisseria gonorrhoeae]|uniref:Uncharacterized protein n=4 Tax=Neisseria gonorrhoeae TaxID=485 RepID=A0AA44U9P6_NEIGO|nr:MULTISPECIES: hypothetical protein [Neisseria]KLS41853.1 hypothetical protein M689_07195 [Neisseria gonorrhoeae SK23020]ANJ48400.1 hypothetical protein ASO12_08470 [Neisseria gonorrhoeae]ANJ50592.1 hypothetical protein A9Y60_08410 [Neisseria gonorrhoeae]APW53600.1 hypothetical protein T556_07025 [Neisseria gonorrhoeae NG-k51.05]ASQ71804.1 hypothetical protein BZG33_09140 [Neisseria gonorrhoeae]
MILIIFINCIINQLFISHCTGLYVPFPTIFANKRKDRLSDGIKLPPPSFPPVLPPAGIIRIVQKMPYNRRTPCPADASAPSGKQNIVD